MQTKSLTRHLRIAVGTDGTTELCPAPAAGPETILPAIEPDITPDTIQGIAPGTAAAVDPTVIPGIVPCIVPGTELDKILGAAVIGGMAATGGAGAEDGGAGTAGTETGATGIGAEIGAAGGGTEAEITIGDTTGPGALAGVTERPLSRPVRPATPTPATTPTLPVPGPMDVPRGTNNRCQHKNKW